MTIRPARAVDLGTLVAHRRAMWGAIGGFQPDELRRADPVYRRWVRPKLRSGRAFAVLAEVDGVPVGSGVIWLREDQPRPGAPRLTVPYIMSVYVAPGHRGLRIATRLTEGLVAWARERGFPRVLLHASPFGRSVYARLGFERTWEMRLGGRHGSGPERTVPADEAPEPPDGAGAPR